MSAAHHCSTGSPRVLESPGKSHLSWNVLEISWNLKVSWNVLENENCPGKASWKILHFSHRVFGKQDQYNPRDRQPCPINVSHS